MSKSVTKSFNILFLKFIYPPKNLKSVVDTVKWKNTLLIVFRIMLLTGIGFMILMPIVIKVLKVIMSNDDWSDPYIIFIPKHFTIEKIILVWDLMKYPFSFVSSLKSSLIVAIPQIVVSSIVAYGFARYKFKFREIWFALVILTLIIPPQMTSISQYLDYRSFNFIGLANIFGTNKSVSLLDSYWPLFLSSIFAVGFKSGLYIFMLRQVFRNMPKETEESAIIDGAGPLKIFLKIMLPGAVSVILAVGLFSFVWQWTDIYFISMFNSKEYTLPVALSQLTTAYTNYYKAFDFNIDQVLFDYAKYIYDFGSVLVIIPLIVLYIVSQKYFIEGIERSGIVG